MISNFKTNVKNFLLKLRIHKFTAFLIRPTLLASNTIKLSKWISQYVNTNNREAINFKTRDELYSYVANTQELINEKINYLEFGVYEGESIKWWTKTNTNINSKFFGFDTFEGLPEKWGNYDKGDFYSNVPNIDDNRVNFIKGLFQDTLYNFLKNYENINRLVINIDSDLFSSALFVLTRIAPYLKKNDIILFDEFNVPNDEFSAFEIFCRSYYIKYELLGSTKNYFQLSIKIL